MNNNKIFFFHIEVEWKIRFHDKRRINYKIQRKLQSKKSLPVLSRYLFRNSDKSKLHRRTFDPSTKRQIHSMCSKKVFGYQRS